MRREPAASVRADPSGPILHRNVTIVRVAEPQILAELKASPSLGPYIGLCLSDRVAVVQRQAGARFVKALREARYTPKVTRHDAHPDS